MRSALIIFLLLVVAFVQGLSRIDAQAAHETRALIDRQVESQRPAPPPAPSPGR